VKNDADGARSGGGARPDARQNLLISKDAK
jgi:hypothetical protein